MDIDLTNATISRRSVLGLVTAGTALAGVGVALQGAPADAAGAVIGTLKIPKLGIVKNVYADVTKSSLDRGGVGHWRGTPKPGQKGNCVLFGHRTSAGGPLRNVHKLRKGDKFRMAGVVYTVSAVQILKRTDSAKMLQWGDPSRRCVSLASCSRADGRPTSLSYRIVIRAMA